MPKKRSTKKAAYKKVTRKVSRKRPAVGKPRRKRTAIGSVKSHVRAAKDGLLKLIADKEAARFAAPKKKTKNKYTKDIRNLKSNYNKLKNFS